MLDDGIVDAEIGDDVVIPDSLAITGRLFSRYKAALEPKSLGEFMKVDLMRFDTVVLERRRAARGEEAEGAEGAEGAISSEGLGQ
jgi:hypothetical protein